MKKIAVLLIILIFPILSFAKKNKFEWDLKAGAFNRVVEDKSYIIVGFKPFFRYEKFYAALDLEFAFDEEGSLKQDDWDNVRAILEKFSYIGYGEKGEDPFFLRLGLLDDITMGYGILVNHFRNDIYYPEIRKLGFYGGYDIGYNGFTGFMEDSIDIDLFGGRVFARPLFGVESNSPFHTVRKLEIGFGFVMDKDPLDQETSGLTDDDSASETVKAYSLDLLVPLLERKNFTLENYVQYGDIVGIGAGLGYGFKGKIHKVLEYKAELSYSWGGFIPGYFSSFYLMRDVRMSLYDTTKNADNGFGYLLGMYANFLKKQLRMGIEFSDNEAEKPKLLFYTFLKPKVLERLFLKFNYQRKEIAGLVDAFDTNKTGENTLILLEIGYEITKNAAISVRYILDYEEVNGVVTENSLTEIQTNLLF